MSTKFTSRGTPMIESRSLQLVQRANSLSEAVVRFLCAELKREGYAGVTPSLLTFLSVLECGVNYASEVARAQAVSRQMVAKSVKEACRLGYLDQVDDVGRQKKILFTVEGERLVSDTRRLLHEMDTRIGEQISERSLDALIKRLITIQDSLAAAQQKEP